MNYISKWNYTIGSLNQAQSKPENTRHLTEYQKPKISQLVVYVFVYQSSIRTLRIPVIAHNKTISQMGISYVQCERANPGITEFREISRIPKQYIY